VKRWSGLHRWSPSQVLATSMRARSLQFHGNEVRSLACWSLIGCIYGWRRGKGDHHIWSAANPANYFSLDQPLYLWSVPTSSVSFAVQVFCGRNWPDWATCRRRPEEISVLLPNACEFCCIAEFVWPSVYYVQFWKLVWIDWEMLVILPGKCKVNLVPHNISHRSHS
jgi:hypothetical protein